jgi:hypothetical protein
LGTWLNDRVPVQQVWDPSTANKKIFVLNWSIFTRLA